MRRQPNLVPLRELEGDPRRAAEVRLEARVARIWPMLVGPALVRHTRLIRIRQKTLTLGCWEPSLVPHLRRSVEATWPEVQARLERLLRAKLQRIEVVPCDPPEAPPQKPPVEDPLEAVLRKYRSLRNQGWTSGRK